MTLLFGLLLLMGAGILAFSAGRTGIVEQRIATNEQEATGVQQAAQAGLDYALAWLAERVWTPDGEPLAAPDVIGTNGQTFRIDLALAQRANAICVRSRASAVHDPGITAVAWECFIQTGLFDTALETTMPAPLVLAGCMSEPTASIELFLLDETASAARTGADTACLPRGSIEVSTWQDHNLDRVLSPDEKGSSGAFRRARFDGCPGTHCAWEQVFAMPLDETKQHAENAGHVFTDSIPCGSSQAPGIYLIRATGAIDSTNIVDSCLGEDGVDSRTIGAPSQPILLIVPSDSGCPSFDRDIQIHGIVYFESPTACAGQGWGGARIQGAVIWEGDVQAPAEGSVFIETDQGAGSALNTAFRVINGATRVPGTWRDWE
ncbi:hypothetical protein [Thiocystis violacea]|uniref:hypothetical protein n=1 Tax=Thiocystis violacea TaxID=13725 RepID=UPI001F5B6C83|nr:hypothetical protein [Thiocystis violacea]